MVSWKSKILLSDIIFYFGVNSCTNSTPARIKIIPSITIQLVLSLNMKIDISVVTTIPTEHHMAYATLKFMEINDFAKHQKLIAYNKYAPKPKKIFLNPSESLRNVDATSSNIIAINNNNCGIKSPFFYLSKTTYIIISHWLLNNIHAIFLFFSGNFYEYFRNKIFFISRAPKVRKIRRAHV